MAKEMPPSVMVQNSAIGDTKYRFLAAAKLSGAYNKFELFYFLLTSLSKLKCEIEVSGVGIH